MMRFSYQGHPAPAEERFFAKVDMDGPVPSSCPDLGPCWLWLASKDRGYGQFWNGLKHQVAYKYSYELVNGPVPKGLELDHLCRVHECVNPKHLEPVPHRVNLLRGESFAAIGIKKTHCLRGHEYTAENTYLHITRTKRRRRCR